jgi:hypothetical protein
LNIGKLKESASPEIMTSLFDFRGCKSLPTQPRTSANSAKGNLGKILSRRLPETLNQLSPPSSILGTSGIINPSDHERYHTNDIFPSRTSQTPSAPLWMIPPRARLPASLRNPVKAEERNEDIISWSTYPKLSLPHRSNYPTRRRLRHIIK